MTIRPHTSEMPVTSPLSWLRYIAIPKLSSEESQDFAALALAGDIKFPLRAPVTSATGLHGHLERMINVHGPLVLLKIYIPFAKAPTLVEAYERRRAVKAAKAHIYPWMWAHAQQCNEARVVVKTDPTGSVYALMVLPLAVMAVTEQLALINVSASSGELVRFSPYCDCAGAIFDQQQARRIARLMCRFPDGRLELPERHPARLALLNELAELQLKLEAPEERSSLSFFLPKNWQKIAQAMLVLYSLPEAK